MTAHFFVVFVALTALGGAAPAQSKQTAPESFTANAQATGFGGGVAGTLRFQVDAYTAEAERERLRTVLTTGGFAEFVKALKAAPSAGYVQIGDRKVAIRWARSQPTPTGGRHIVLVTEAPIYFVGGGAADAAPTAGYEVAVVQFDLDANGFGSGTMAAAAKVKVGGEAGVQIDDYAKEPVKLVTVSRKI